MDLNPEGPSLYVSTGIIRFDHLCPTPSTTSPPPPPHTHRGSLDHLAFWSYYSLRLYLVAWRGGDP